MSFLYTPMLILFIVDSVLLMIVILLQDSKGQGLAGAFGGGGFSTSMFGGRGAATFLSKATTFLGTAFLVLAIVTFVVFLLAVPIFYGLVTEAALDFEPYKGLIEFLGR